MTFELKGKNPNLLHDFLIKNGCTPVSIGHNAVDDIVGDRIKDATEVYIKIEDEKVGMLTTLVERFTAI